MDSVDLVITFFVGKEKKEHHILLKFHSTDQACTTQVTEREHREVGLDIVAITGSVEPKPRRGCWACGLGRSTAGARRDLGLLPLPRRMESRHCRMSGEDARLRRRRLGKGRGRAATGRGGATPGHRW